MTGRGRRCYNSYINIRDEVGASAGIVRVSRRSRFHRGKRARHLYNLQYWSREMSEFGSAALACAVRSSIEQCVQVSSASREESACIPCLCSLGQLHAHACACGVSCTVSLAFPRVFTSADAL